MTLPTPEEALEATRESRSVEFKSSFRPGNTGDWCEIIKDIAALANSGGGYILIGVDNSGRPGDFDATDLLAMDPAQVLDRIARYVGTEFDGIEIISVQKGGHTLAMLRIEPVDIPFPFIRPGEYEEPAGNKKKAFAEGTVYFRHGAKSAPAHRNHLRGVVKRAELRLRHELHKNLMRAVKAPLGSTVIVTQAAQSGSPPEYSTARLVDDPRAPAFRRSDPDATHPYRAKELIAEVNRGLPGGCHINQFDITCIRHIHQVDTNAQFAHQPKFGSRQYSTALLEWIVEQHRLDPNFFSTTRARYAASD